LLPASEISCIPVKRTAFHLIERYTDLFIDITGQAGEQAIAGFYGLH
jgi:hypothetical protein